MHVVRRPLWLLGLFASGCGLLLHALALSSGRLVVVQPLLVSGMLFALPASLLLERRTPSGREWFYASAVVAGLSAFLIAANPRGGQTRADPRMLSVATLTAVIFAMSVVVLASTLGRRHGGAILGLAAGVCFGTTGALLKQVVGQFSAARLEVLTTWPMYAFLAIGIFGTVLAQSSYRAGALSASLPPLTIADPLVALAFGVAAFGEQFASNPLARSGQVGGFALMSWAALRLASLNAASSSPVLSPEPDSHDLYAPAVRERVLVLSASIGGGHDGAATELTRRLKAAKAEVRGADFLDLLPFGIGWLARNLYRVQLRFAPRTYEALYRGSMSLPIVWRGTVLLCTLLSRRRINREIALFDPKIIVSVYPLASVAVGRMRTKGWINLPAVTYLTDFSVHPLWIHPGIDLHLATNRASQKAATEHGATHTTTVGPLVRPAFAQHHNRSEARSRLFIPAERPVAVLVVAGSWGVGSVVETVKAIADCGAFHPVCVCGRNERLRQHLERLGVGTIIGWTDRMDDVMAGCDVVVENAGGLTCMEALAAGLPVVTFAPIPGHGRHNAEVMAAAGVVSYARTRDELKCALDRAVRTRPKQGSSEELLGGATLDAADQVLKLASYFLPSIEIVSEPLALRRATRAFAFVAATYLAATIGFGVAAAHGLGVDMTGTDWQRPTIVGIRLNSQQLGSGRVAEKFVANHVAAIVDARTACAASENVKTHALSLMSAGDGQTQRFAWREAEADIHRASKDIIKCTGIATKWFVALRRVNAFDWTLARDSGLEGILAPRLVRPPAPLTLLAPHHLYVIDATSLSSVEVLSIVDRLAEANTAGRITMFSTIR